MRLACSVTTAAAVLLLTTFQTGYAVAQPRPTPTPAERAPVGEPTRPPASPTPRPTATPPACTATVSGALAGSSTCTVVAATQPVSSGFATIGMTASAAGFSINAALQSANQFSQTQWTCANLPHSAIVVRTPSQKVWMASPTQGSCTLQLTWARPAAASSTNGVNPNSTLYTVHGQLQATLPPMPGSAATGTVSLSISF